SLVLADVPTAPPAQHVESEIDKVDTRPNNVQRDGTVPLSTPLPLNTLGTVPSGAVPVASPVAPMARAAKGSGRSSLTAVEEGTLTSWTTGRGAHSPLARRIISSRRAPMGHLASSLWTSVFNPLDSLRWWLLIPGRLEFLLWFSGTILLMSVTC